MFLPTFLPTDSTSQPVGGTNVQHSRDRDSRPARGRSIPIHSSIGFGVKHFGVSTFRGSFSGAAGTLVTDDGALRAVEGKVRIENLVTEEPQLTGHLHSEDFFDAANYPEITFKSTSIEQAEDDRLRINGDLTIRGVTTPGRARRRDRGRRRRPVRQHARSASPPPAPIDRTRLGHHLERAAARQRRARRR